MEFHGFSGDITELAGIAFDIESGRGKLVRLD
jgi:hypothetical protein